MDDPSEGALVTFVLRSHALWSQNVTLQGQGQQVSFSQFVYP